MERARTIRAYVGLGANLGDAEATMRAALDELASLPGVRIRAVSRLYATRPVGVADQPEFRNAAVTLDVRVGADLEAAAVALLVALKATEQTLGRRVRRHWGPRELDLDILVFGGRRVEIERPDAGLPANQAKAARPAGRFLVIPHPEAHERLFVLAPLADLAPRLVPPGWGERVETARRRRLAIEGPGAVHPIGLWDPGAGDWIGLSEDRSVG